MKYLFLFLFTFSLNAETVFFMPENQLSKQDTKEEANISKELFNKIIDTAIVEYEEVTKEFGDTLTVNAKWEDSTVNASAGRFFKWATLNFYGGLARRKEVTPGGFTLVVCHELGHLYGGTPYIREWGKLSAEGQADYYGVKECMHKVLQHIEEDFYTPTEYMLESCEKETNLNDNSNGNSNEEIAVDEMCVRKLLSGQSVGDLFASMKSEEAPQYETPDETVVEKTILSYPETIQCRLDTYFNATKNLERPACWFKD